MTIDNLTRKLTEGVSYEEYKWSIRPLDLLLFRGSDFVSATIRHIQKSRTGRGEFSHAGIVVTRDVLDHPRMVPGKLYVLESTVTGWLGCGVKNIENKSEFGVQITDLDKLIEKYDHSRNTSLAVFHLKNDAFFFGSVKLRLNRFWSQIHGRSYQFNLLSMLTVPFPFLRGGRKQAEKLLGGENWVFCSELVCMVMQAVGFISPAVDAKTVMPIDFLDCDEDGLVPRGLFSNASKPVYLLNKKWARKQRRIKKACVV